MHSTSLTGLVKRFSLVLTVLALSSFIILVSVYAIPASAALNPQYVGQSNSVLSNPRDFVLRNNYAYVTSFGNQSLFIFDISDPIHPITVGVATSSQPQPRGIALKDNYAYVVDQNNGGSSAIDVFNISDPAHPMLVSSVAALGGDSYGAVRINGSYLYIGGLLGVLHVYDISNPTAPVQVGTLTFPSGQKLARMDIQGNYLYQPTQSTTYGLQDGLYVVDISNPAAPSRVGFLYTNGDAPIEVEAHGQYAYMRGEAGDVVIVDISNPTNPILAGSFPGSVDGGTGLAVHGNYVFTTNFANSLDVVDVSDVAHPVRVATTAEGLYTPSRIILNGNYGYVINRAGGTGSTAPAFMSVFNLTDFVSPPTPPETGSTTLTASAATIGDLTVTHSLVTQGTASFSSLTGAVAGQAVVSVQDAYAYPILTTLSNGHVGIGTNAPQETLSVKGALVATTTGQMNGVSLDFTSEGSGAIPLTALRVYLNPGYVGSSNTSALSFVNYAAGTGNNYVGGASNTGIYGLSRGVTSGDRVGIYAIGRDGDTNVGVFGRTTIPKISSVNVAVVGLSDNATGIAAVGGYFGLGGFKPAISGSAALMADNGVTTAPIFVGRANGVEAFRIDNGGAVGIGTSTLATGSKLAVYGGGIVLQPGTSTKPGCSVTTRGMMWNTFGGTGVADTLQICQKNASDSYVWVTK